jgi:hypothetical protein
MEAFAEELDACLAALDAPDEDLDATVAVRPAQTHARARKPVSRWAIASIVLGILALAAVVIGLAAIRGLHLRDGSTPSAAAAIHLKGIGSWDPFGDNHEEHSSAAPNATDGNESTYWETEHYDSGLGKPGVGLVLDAGRPVKPHGIELRTGTPGFMAEIQAGNDRGGIDFHSVSKGGPESINGRTTLELDLHSAQRYFVVWITRLPPGSPSVQIDEVTAA